MKLKNKKRFYIKILICIILIAIFLLTIILFNLNKVSKKNILKLLNNGIENINFSEISEDGTIIYYHKNICKVEYANGSINYSDYNAGESIYISDNDKTITIYSNDFKKNNVHYSKYLEYFEDEDRYEYSYEGRETINNEKCYIISLLCKEKGKTGSQALKKLWINKELGTIEKLAEYSYLDGTEELLYEVEYNMHENNVSESDVSKPNLNLYDEYETLYN